MYVGGQEQLLRVALQLLHLRLLLIAPIPAHHQLSAILLMAYRLFPDIPVVPEQFAVNRPQLLRRLQLLTVRIPVFQRQSVILLTDFNLSPVIHAEAEVSVART